MSESAGRVLVVEDEADVRESLSRLLRSAGHAVQAFASAAELLEATDVEQAACLVLDVNMPGMSGPELHEVLREREIDLPIIYLTGRSNIAIGVRAMKRGAYDFLEKPVDADELLAAIEQASALHEASAGQRRECDQIRSRMQTLSLREREVMEHVIRGRLNKQIAGDLGIAEKTVKVHRSRVMAKMKVRSVAELVRLCDQAGGVPSPAGGGDR